MNSKILLLTTFTAISLFASAQDETYAITGSNSHDSLWKNIRVINTATGKLIKDVPAIGSSDLVAAAAYDKTHNRLFFCTMQTGELKWVNFSDNSLQLNENQLQGQHFSTTNNIYDQSDNVTRMCIGADGKGYAISNDCNHLYSFTTNNTSITDLGSLTDDANNGGTSVHNQCSSWGGDMIADAFGKLYLITANHFVFSIDVTTKIATLMGSITGLPFNFPANGAAVDGEGNVIVGSATGKGFYTVDFNNLSATKIQNADTSYAVSDLAGGNLLFQNTVTSPISATLQSNDAAPEDSKIYPNPITGTSFSISLSGQKAGDYTVTLTGLEGRSIQSSKVILAGTVEQTVQVQLLTKLASGTYIVKVVDAAGATILLNKVFVN
ncbi:MAG TPA: T9SS type A sorting domain-containing protein [Ferruginibacter sp.]|jgi:hypothetical protein|nr:T9SS type A sorting domain-containing protein [Ferruginibacter sp.]